MNGTDLTAAALAAGTESRVRPARRYSRLILILLLSAVMVCAWVVVHVGWFDRGRSWEETTGWESIAPELRAPVTRTLPTAAGPLSVVWLGHAGFLLDWDGTRLYLDPNTSQRCTVAPRLVDPVPDVAALPAADAVLVSHAHYDHFDLPTMERMARPGMIVVPSGSGHWLGSLQELAHPLQPWDSVDVRGLRITAVPAAHNGNRFHPLASSNLALGYVVTRGTEALYFAGDTGPSNDFEGIRDRFHPAVAILPIGAFRPSFPMRRYHLSPDDAVDAARRLGSPTVIPCHFGTFVLALDGTAEALPAFARAAHEQGIRWVMPSMETGGLP